MNNVICAIDVTGFASVMIVLMVLMMYCASFANTSHHGISVDLPYVANPIPLSNEGREDAMNVVITRQADIFFGRDLIKAADQLPGLIRERVRAGSERRLYVRADARALYRTVKEVVDAAHAAGLEHITFIAERNRTSRNR